MIDVGEVVRLLNYPTGDVYGTVRESHGFSAAYPGKLHVVVNVTGVPMRVWGGFTRKTEGGLALVDVYIAEAWVPPQLRSRARKPRAPKAPPATLARGAPAEAAAPPPGGAPPPDPTPTAPDSAVP